jgi:homoserine dehydrogenase
VTAIKAMISVHGNEIFAAASANNVMVAYEASVAGGIPIIKAIREGLAGNSIQWLAGIINGTGNFILTEMREENRAFADVLKEAQALGYAEADPTFDVEGIDAAHKLTILASIAFGIPLQFDRTYTEGISHITQEDIHYADELGYRIKHLGISRRTADGIELRVHPTMIDEESMLANVNGVMNAVMVNGDAVGSTLYYGAGAGAAPTASAVVADIIDVARMISSPQSSVPALAFQDGSLSDIRIKEITEIKSAYYLRITAMDKVGVLADITEILGQCAINIEAIIQKEPRGTDATSQRVPVIILTRELLEETMNTAIARIEQLDCVAEKVTRIRVFKIE